VGRSSRKARMTRRTNASVVQTRDAQRAAHHCTGDASARYNLMQAERGGNERPAYRSAPSSDRCASSKRKMMTMKEGTR
jgi:hypothetical protein